MMAKNYVLNSIPELLDDIREGRMVVLMDDEEPWTRSPPRDALVAALFDATSPGLSYRS